MTVEAATSALIARAGSLVTLALAASTALATPGSTLNRDAAAAGHEATISSRSSTDDGAEAIAIQRDGKIVAAGGTHTLGGDFALARYMPSGKLDPAFGRGGKVTNALRPEDGYGAQGLSIQRDGKIVAAGATGGCTETSRFLIARYTTEGHLDASFGSGGSVTTAIGTSVDGAHAVAIQPDGRIVAAGWDCARGGRFALVRYLRNGRLDPSFGRGGRVLTDVGGSHLGADAIVVQADGKLVAAGSGNAQGSTDFALVRYRSDGSLDPSFRAAGVALTDFGAAGDDEAEALAIQPDGKLIAVGYGSVEVEFATVRDFAVARYNPDGNLDASFGTEGKVLTDLGGTDEAALAVALQKDGKLVVAGVGGPESGAHFALLRYHSDGRLDQSFGAAGKVLTRFSRLSEDGASAVAIQADGKAVAAGASAAAGDDYDFALTRRTANGRLDPSFGRGGQVLTDFALGTRLASLSATRTENGAVVRWRTSREFETAGFNVYREENRRRLRANASLISSRHIGGGASYSFVDRGAGASTSRYWLQEVKVDGTVLLLNRVNLRRVRPPFTG